VAVACDSLAKKPCELFVEEVMGFDRRT